VNALVACMTEKVTWANFFLQGNYKNKAQKPQSVLVSSTDVGEGFRNTFFLWH
jgi:hypothetical protein